MGGAARPGGPLHRSIRWFWVRPGVGHDTVDESSDDVRYLVVNGRRWRRQDPALPEDVAARLTSHLGRARSAVRTLKRAEEDPAPARHRVGLAKRGLGERGRPWWEQSHVERRARWEGALLALDEVAPSVSGSS